MCYGVVDDRIEGRGRWWVGDTVRVMKVMTAIPRRWTSVALSWALLLSLQCCHTQPLTSAKITTPLPTTTPTTTATTTTTTTITTTVTPTTTTTSLLHRKLAETQGLSKDELLDALLLLVEEARPGAARAVGDGSGSGSTTTGGIKLAPARPAENVSRGGMDDIHLKVGVVVDAPLTRRKNIKSVVAGNSREHYDGEECRVVAVVV